MNFQALKGMINNLIKTFKCPECDSSVSEQNVEIIGAAGSNINIDIGCPKCQKHSMVRAEVMPIDFKNLNINKKNLNSIKDNLMGLQNKIEQRKKSESIKDEEIVKLNQNLKKQKLNVKDLLET